MDGLNYEDKYSILVMTKDEARLLIKEIETCKLWHKLYKSDKKDVIEKCDEHISIIDKLIY